MLVKLPKANIIGLNNLPNLKIPECLNSIKLSPHKPSKKLRIKHWNQASYQAREVSMRSAKSDTSDAELDQDATQAKDIGLRIYTNILLT